MHTRISEENQYGYDRKGFAWENVPVETEAHLDFGCNDGAFLNALKNKKIGRLTGVDVSREAIEKGQRSFPELDIVHIRKGTDLPFENATFSSISILDVLEHVYEQAELLAELNRALKDGGKLIVTVPGQHLFSFLDIGNFKFRFPRLHRWYYCLGHCREDYESRYVSNPDGLIGDISAKKSWHEHFSRKKLSKVLGEAGFRVVEFDGTGFFQRLLGITGRVFQWFKPINKLLRWLQSIDNKKFESTNLFCVAEKSRIP